MEIFTLTSFFLYIIYQVDTPVIGRHPDCTPGYAPAMVQNALPDLYYQVRFYNGALAQVPSEELFLIDGALYGQVVEDILKKEDGWVGHPVVARKEEDGKYYLGEHNGVGDDDDDDDMYVEKEGGLRL